MKLTVHPCSDVIETLSEVGSTSNDIGTSLSCHPLACVPRSTLLFRNSGKGKNFQPPETGSTYVLLVRWEQRSHAEIVYGDVCRHLGTLFGFGRFAGMRSLLRCFPPLSTSLLKIKTLFAFFLWLRNAVLAGFSSWLSAMLAFSAVSSIWQLSDERLSKLEAQRTSCLGTIDCRFTAVVWQEAFLTWGDPSCM